MPIPPSFGREPQVVVAASDVSPELLRHLPHYGQLPMLLHYICLASVERGRERADEWASATCWNASRVVFWTEYDVLQRMTARERSIYSHYAQPMQKLHLASYVVLGEAGGAFVHPNYVPHSLFWSSVGEVWQSHASACTTLLAERGLHFGSCGPCRWWNGLLCAVPHAPSVQYLRQLIAPRYLTPATTADDAEFTTGCYLLQQLDAHTLTASSVGTINAAHVRSIVRFVPFHPERPVVAGDGDCVWTAHVGAPVLPKIFGSSSE
jgi:hypothetical protein